jgi:hypothetical protein
VQYQISLQPETQLAFSGHADFFASREGLRGEASAGARQRSDSCALSAAEDSSKQSAQP